jgi:hypothetical protein
LARAREASWSMHEDELNMDVQASKMVRFLAPVLP